MPQGPIKYKGITKDLNMQPFDAKQPLQALNVHYTCKYAYKMFRNTCGASFNLRRNHIKALDTPV